MTPSIFVSLSSVLVLGIFGQWLAWRIRIPAILPLLILGFITGPITAIVNPDMLLGDLLFPVVSLFVGIILFEGGLNLKFSEIKGVGRLVWRLNSVGAIVNWGAIAALAYFFLGFDVGLSLLLGAILMVTGPTVIGPLLRQVKLHARVSSVLKWEGIIIDPIGAIATLLVFEVVFGGRLQDPLAYILSFIASTLVIGLAFGLAGATIIVIMLKKHWVPDYLQSVVTLGLVVAAFCASNVLVHESGLLTVTVMGIFLANQKVVPISHILEFKENLTILLISTLFIVLSARIPIQALWDQVTVSSVLFLVGVIVLARPLSMMISCAGSDLNWRQKLFMGLIAPRGIIAAMICSLFALKLVEIGVVGSDRIVIVTFMVIIATVLWASLVAAPLSKLLGVEQPRAHGLLIAGAHPFARQIALALRKLEIESLIVDTNKSHILAAKDNKLTCLQTSILSDQVLDYLDSAAHIGRLLAMMPNDDLNVLAAKQFSDTFGKPKIYRLFPEDLTHRNKHNGQLLFDDGVTMAVINAKLLAGAAIQNFMLSEAFSMDEFELKYGNSAIPLFLVNDKKQIFVFSKGKRPAFLGDRQYLVALVPKERT